MPWLRVQAGLRGGCSGREGAAGETRCNPLHPVPQWLAVVDRVTSGAGVRGILEDDHQLASWHAHVCAPQMLPLLAPPLTTPHLCPVPHPTDGLQELQVCRAAHGVVSTHQTPPARPTRLSGAAAHPRTAAACLAWRGRGALLATTTTMATHSRGEPDGWLPHKGSNDIHKTNNEQPMALLGLVAAARANPMRLKPMPASCICLKPMPAPIHLAARTDTTPQSTTHPPHLS